MWHRSFFYASLFLAAEDIQPASPSDPGSGYLFDSQAGALQVPAQPGPVLCSVSAPSGPAAQPARDRCWCCPQPAEQCTDKEALQRGIVKLQVATQHIKKTKTNL